MSSEEPLVVYPNPVTKQAPSHSNGSFGAVFIVLAMIVVLSAAACCLSRFCSRRHHHSKAKHSHDSRPKERKNKAFHGGDIGDIEFGFEKGTNSAAKKGGNFGEGKGSRPAGNGGVGGGGPRFAGEWEGKAGQYGPV